MNIKPTFDEAKKLAKGYKTLSLSVELALSFTPLQVLKKLKKISSHCYMPESCEDSENRGRYTFLGYDPKEEISCIDYNVTVTDADGVMRNTENPRPFVQRLWGLQFHPESIMTPQGKTILENFLGGK